jgi:predicted nuclease of predicted toxin-antitoxin system
MKLKVDENLPIEIASRLREAGHEAQTAGDEGLGGAPDSEVIDRCLAEGRALITLDQDFGNIRSYPPVDYQGLVVLDLRVQAKPHVLAVFERVVSLLHEEPLTGRLWIVQDNRIRIRE